MYITNLFFFKYSYAVTIELGNKIIYENDVILSRSVATDILPGVNNIIFSIVFYTFYSSIVIEAYLS